MKNNIGPLQPILASILPSIEKLKLMGASRAKDEYTRSIIVEAELKGILVQEKDVHDAIDEAIAAETPKIIPFHIDHYHYHM